ncbi:MAG: hypothetical protein HYY24_17775 [Verrucomicrobia bacterium]|nr:hypothetical protein [Verrucomicrobiota bacterium]
MKRGKTTPRFVLCMEADADSDLTPRKGYDVLADPKAEREGFLRVLDESGDDYLYPADCFVDIGLPPTAKRRLVHFREEVSPVT